MSTRDAMTAVRRFGLGPKSGDIARVSSDPRGYALAALSNAGAAAISGAHLEPSHAVFARVYQASVELQLARAFGNDGGKLSGSAGPGMTMPPPAVAVRPSAPNPADSATNETIAKASTPQPAAKAAAGTPAQIRREVLTREITARLAHAQSTDAPLLERLVMFWSNHFCINANKGGILGIAGAYEREVIRPHVLGRFADMLTAVEQHPAMLIYLDNRLSTGPNSQVGRNRNRGLNENLAREILELHTLGVDGGYTQADVTSLARVITGWTVGNPNQANAEHGKFFFAAPRHEPGNHLVLGKSYGNAGVRAGERCLADLARHPSTAHHLARKLAAHFVSETPPPALVSKLEVAFRDSDGDLSVVSRTLVTSDEAWTAPAAKITPPYDFLVALQRALGPEWAPPLEVGRLAAALGQPLWRPPSPKGWPDGDETWASPSTLRERLRIAERAAVYLTQHGRDARAMADAIYGAAMGQETRQAIARAEAREQAFALMIMSLEVQRR